MKTSLNVLLVDDDPIFHFLNTKILKRLGLTEISTVLNGKEALKFLGDNRSENQSMPDAIFVDLDMPILNGFGFIEAFEKLNIPERNKTRIAILTSSADPKDIERANQLGISHYLTKPASENSMRTVLDSLVGQR